MKYALIDRQAMETDIGTVIETRVLVFLKTECVRFCICTFVYSFFVCICVFVVLYVIVYSFFFVYLCSCIHVLFWE